MLRYSSCETCKPLLKERRLPSMREFKKIRTSEVELPKVAKLCLEKKVSFY